MKNVTPKIAKINKNKNISSGLMKRAGRNNQGRITVRHRGGGHKRLYMPIDFKRQNDNGIVLNIEYDPNRSSHIVKMLNLETSNFFYSLESNGIKPFDFIEKSESKPQDKIIGNHYLLKNLDVGDKVHSIQLKPSGTAKLVRSAGNFGTILQYSKIKNQDCCLIQLPSGEKRWVPVNCYATFGSIGNQQHSNRNIKKAGRNRWLGKRPTVRGVAMNPIDHPHGGGEGKTSGGRPSVTPWGIPTKGYKTRNNKKLNIFIAERRK